MYTQGLMGWGYMRLCCHLVGSRSLISLEDSVRANTFVSFSWLLFTVLRVFGSTIDWMTYTLPDGSGLSTTLYITLPHTSWILLQPSIWWLRNKTWVPFMRPSSLTLTACLATHSLTYPLLSPSLRPRTWSNSRRGSRPKTGAYPVEEWGVTLYTYTSSGRYFGQSFFFLSESVWRWSCYVQLNRSHCPFPCGWYGVVRPLVIPYMLHNSCINELSNFRWLHLRNNNSVALGHDAWFIFVPLQRRSGSQSVSHPLQRYPGWYTGSQRL